MLVGGGGGLLLVRSGRFGGLGNGQTALKKV